MLITCESDSAKFTVTTNRLNSARNNLEYNKLKASTLTLHLTNRKAKNHIMYKTCIKKIARYIN